MSKLTWEIIGGDDEISKKRRGEFPKQCPKKSKIDLSLYLSNLAQRNGINAAGNKNKVAILQNVLSSAKTGKQKSVCVFDNDSDIEDEIRMLVAQEDLRNPKQTSKEDDDGNLEVVGDDFVVKSNVFWGGVEQDDVKTSLLTSSKDDEEYDSADTDEILTLRKTQKTQVESAPVTQDSPTESSKNKSESDDGSDEASDDGSDEASDDDSASVDSDYEAMMGNCYRLDLSLADLEQLAKRAEMISDDESVEEPKTPNASPKKTGNNPEDILAYLLGDDTTEKESKKKKKNQVNTVSLPAFIGTKDLFGGPEPSLKRVAQNIDLESPKRLKQDLKLKEQSISEDTSPPQSSNSQQKLSTLNKQTASKTLENKASISEDDSSSEESESSSNEDVFTSKTPSASQSVRTIPETELKTVTSNNSNKPNQRKTSRSSSSDSSSEESESSEDEDSAGVLTSKTPSAPQSVKNISKTEMKTAGSNNSKTPVKPNQRKTSRSSSSDSSSEESESSDDETSRTQTKDSNLKNVQENVVSHQTVRHSTVIDAKKQQQDNQKRIAALEQRQKETEQQRKLIQGALSNTVSRASP